jgi:hypothetical protein
LREARLYSTHSAVAPDCRHCAKADRTHYERRTPPISHSLPLRRVHGSRRRRLFRRPLERVRADSAKLYPLPPRRV